jgi:DNA-binding transcriptional LysR family regulator
MEKPQIKRSLRIGCSASVAETFLIPKLKKMKTIDSLHLISGTTRQLTHLLNEEEIHIALSVKGKKESGDRIIHRGDFVLASHDGKLKEQIIVTETRPEVAELKRFFLKQKKEITFLSVESWSLAMKLAVELNCSCLIPDFLIGKDLKKMQLRNFHPEYVIVVENTEREKLSVAENELIELILK